MDANAPQPPAAGAEVETFRRTPFERMKSFLFGDDVFISYARSDSSGYAAALANRLGQKGFVCYLDQYGTDVSDEVPPRLKLKLRRSTVLVLVGSQGAVNSGPIRAEIDLFKETERAIIPIDVDGAFSEPDKLYPTVVGLPIASDRQPAPGNALRAAVAAAGPKVTPVAESAASLRRAEPSPRVIAEIASAFASLRRPGPSNRVVERVVNTFTYTRRTQWQRRMLVAGVAFIALSLALAGYYVNVAWAASADALNSQMRAAEAAEATALAERDLRLAASRLTDAERKVTEANNQSDIARETARLADVRAADAAEREQLAKEEEARATANAREQEAVSASRQLAAGGSATRVSDPVSSLILSADAFDKRPTVEARSSLLKGLQSHPQLRRLSRQSANSAIYRVAQTPDGGVLALATLSKLIFLDADSNRVLGIREGIDPGAIAVSRDGARIAAWTGLWSLAVWDVSVEGGQKRVKLCHAGRVPNELGNGSHSLAFNHDGSAVIFAASIFVPNPFRLELKLGFLNVKTGKPDLYPTGVVQINSLALSRDGRTLAVGGDEAIELWDVERREVLATLIIGDGDTAADAKAEEWADDKFESLSFSHDGRTLASARSSGALIIWDVEGRSMIGRPHEGVGREVAFDPRPGSMLLTTLGEGKRLTVWEVAAGAQPPQKLWSEVYEPGITGMSLNGRDGSVLTGNADGTIAVWARDAQSRLGQTVPAGVPDYLDFNRQGTLLLAGRAPWNVKLWGVSARPPYLASRDARAVESGAFTPWAQGALGPDGRRRGVKLWNMPPRENEGLILPVEYDSFMLTVSADGKRLAGIEHHNVAVWDITDRRNPRRVGAPLKHPRGEMATGVAFNRGGNLLAVGYFSGEVILWDLTGRIPPKLFNSAETVVPGAFNQVYYLAVSDDGKAVVTSGQSNPRLYLWDASEARPTLLGSLDKAPTPPGNREQSTAAMAFSPDGKTLVTAGRGGIIVWDIDPRSWSRRARQIVAGGR